jgi:anti-sigma B factor antagonist
MTVEITTAARATYTLVAPHGDLDIDTAPRLRRVAVDQLARGVELVVDLSGVGFMDSSGVGCLVAIRREARRSGVELSLVCPEGPVRRVLALMKLDQVLALRSDPDEPAPQPVA